MIERHPAESPPRCTTAACAPRPSTCSSAPTCRAILAEIAFVTQPAGREAAARRRSTATASRESLLRRRARLPRRAGPHADAAVDRSRPPDLQWPRGAMNRGDPPRCCEPAVTWIKVEKPVFDLRGRGAELLGLAGFLLWPRARARARRSGSASSLRRRRQRRDPGRTHVSCTGSTARRLKPPPRARRSDAARASVLDIHDAPRYIGDVKPATPTPPSASSGATTTASSTTRPRAATSPSRSSRASSPRGQDVARGRPEDRRRHHHRRPGPGRCSRGSSSARPPSPTRC